MGGGTPQTVCDIRARGGAWTDLGQILLGGWNSGLFQVAASGGKPSLTTLDASRGELFHYWPQVLPGEHVLYFVRSNKRENTGVYAASSAKPRQRVLNGYFAYHAVPTNLWRLNGFRTEVCRAWRHALLRRSQRHRLNWSRFNRLTRKYIPSCRVLHPYPEKRFFASHPTLGKSRMR
jgi:hypothetical protein